MEALIDDVALLERIAELSERGDDPTGNWIGGGRPRTNHDGAVGIAGTLAKNFARWSATHFAFYAELIRMDDAEDKDRLTVLDLGCAGGARTRQLADHYGSIVGLDRSQKAIKFAEEFNRNDRIGFVRADWPMIGAPVLVDRVFAVEVFEHFAPAVQITAIRAAVNSLSDGGRLLLTMPNEPPQPPPHQGTMQDAAFDALLHQVGATVIHRGHFDNDAPGEPCDEGWRPIGPKPSHHFAVLAR
jgi:SAM-dependent methyltransferase